MIEDNHINAILDYNDDSVVIDLTTKDGRKIAKTVKEIVEKLNDLRKQGLLFQHASGALFLIVKGSRSYTYTHDINEFLSHIFCDGQ
jgi:hypothetical protein